MRYITLLAIMALLSLCMSVRAQSAEFTCQKAYPEMAPEYPKLVCVGNDLLERGKAQEAFDTYEKASQIAFFESPNFLIYYRIAKAQLALGLIDAARKSIKEFQDMLSIYDGSKKCTNFLELEKKATEVMCSEILNPEGYAASKGLSLRKKITHAYRQRINTLLRKN